MEFFTFLDLLATLGFFAALVCAWRTDAPVLHQSSKVLLMVFLSVRIFIGVADFLEDTGITEFLDLFEDYASVLFLPFFVMFIYSVIMNDEMEKRLRSEHALIEANDELEKQYLELLKLDRMKDSFMRNVSHELKTPVAKHAMQIELVENIGERHGIGRELSGVVEVMKGAVERQSLVIRNLLELSRLEEECERQAHENVRIDRLLRQIMEDYSHTIVQNGITVEEEMPETTIVSDRDMLWHVFSNLMSNAIKFRSPGKDAKIFLAIDAKENMVTVRVADNGRGMSPAERERAFEKFFQSSASIEGSGVGLTICRMIVEKLGGSIHLEDGPGSEGTTAVVSLPRKDPSA